MITFNGSTTAKIPPIRRSVKDRPDRFQEQAIKCKSQFALLISSAGTGKTRVLASRCAYLVKSEITSLSQILVLSFSTSAAEAISNHAHRLLHSLGIDTFRENAWTGTFHAFGAEVLRTHGPSYFDGKSGGWSPLLKIASKAQQLELMKKALWETKYIASQAGCESFKIYIYWKSQGLGPVHVSSMILYIDQIIL